MIWSRHQLQSGVDGLIAARRGIQRMLVKQILNAKASRGVLTIEPSARVGDAAKMLSERGVGALVVSASGSAPDGVLSERDIVREIGRQGSDALQHEVTAIMSSKVITCRPGDTADDILAVMTNGRFRHMPVMENDRMIGLISIGDVVKARLDDLHLERDALEGMITGH